MYDKFVNLSPFQCLYDNSGIIVNFGVVVCSNPMNSDFLSESSASGILDYGVFVPKISGQGILKFNQSGFVTTNFISTNPSGSVLSLRIDLYDIQQQVEQYAQPFDSMVSSGDSEAFYNYYSNNFSSQLQKRYFNLDPSGSIFDFDFDADSTLNYAKLCGLNPFVNWSARILDVSIVDYPIQDGEIIEENPIFNFIQKEDDVYYKLVPIAIINNYNIEQILNRDYIFSYPFFWLDSLKENFKNVSTETPIS